MYINKVLFVTFITLLLSGCVTIGKPISFSGMGQDEIESKSKCYISTQCRSLPYGYDGCGNAPDGASGYVIYSTAMGRDNIRALKEYLIEDRERIKQRISDQEYLCTLAIYRKPKLYCSKGLCKRKNDR